MGVGLRLVGDGVGGWCGVVGGDAQCFGWGA